LPAIQGLRIQNSSTQFFANGSNPGGILTAPGAISDETAARLKQHWEQNYTGVNVGKIAVLGDGLKYEKMAVNAVDAQLIEQLKWTAETVCSCYHVPAYMVGVGAPPNYNNIEALNQQYYTQCLQALIEAIELLLDEGLELPAPYGTEMDLDGLLRMDTATQYKAIADGISGAFLTPNEGRRKLDLPPVKGGDSPYMQQQNFSLAALDQPTPPTDPAPATPADDGQDPASSDAPGDATNALMDAWQRSVERMERRHAA
jgi:HK97 family phage portal protein